MSERYYVIVEYNFLPFVTLYYMIFFAKQKLVMKGSLYLLSEKMGQDQLDLRMEKKGKFYASFFGGGEVGRLLVGCRA